MVIAIHTSDSCNTLVSLDNHHNARSKQQHVCSASGACGQPSSVEYRKTALLVPEDDDDLDLSSSSLDSSSYGYCNCAEPRGQSLFLPADKDEAVDESLARVAPLRYMRDELFALGTHHFTEASPEKIIYVHQGEVAHALASQCDVLVSDRATTCHVLALRSTSAGNKEAMTSLTHLDSDHYETCVRKMIQEHKRFHGEQSMDNSDSLYFGKPVEIDIHIMGGFADEEGHSLKISNWLLHLLADIAEEEAACLQMRLQTCAISSLNDTGFRSPMGRGMAIHLATGRVFMAKVSGDMLGPQICLRNARLWSAGEEQLTSELLVIHTTTSNEIVISPFAFEAIPGMDKLMLLPDEILLEYTSTSPFVEEEDFCHSIRETLRFLLEVPSTRIFGRLCDQTLRYVRRYPHSNEWMVSVSA